MRASSSRRQTTWGLFLGTVVNVVAGNSAIADLGDAFSGTDLMIDSTLIRVRGELMLSGPTAIATPDVIWAAAITLGTADQVAVGITAFPDVETDDGDWLWFSTGYLVSNRTSAGAEDDWDPRYIEIDNKAMRKLKERDKRPVFLFKNSAASGGSVRVGIAARMLLKT